MTVRIPEDTEEWVKATLAVADGKGKTIAEVIELLIGEAPSVEMVEWVTLTIQMTTSQEQPVDLQAIITAFRDMQSAWE
jgi:hypothetical protein